MSRNPVLIAADIVRLSTSGIFDRDWYAATYADALKGGADPLVHFCDSGWRRGMRPNSVFDTAYYLAENPELLAADSNPLIHYIDYGEAHDRRPAAAFDVAWYRRTHGLARNVLADYLARRQLPDLSPNPAFDPAWYRDQYPLAEGFNAYEDFCADGRGRDASAEVRTIRESGLFDAEFYARATGGAEPELDPVYRFCRSGWQAGLNPNPLFDTAWYLANNPEVREAGVNPLYHYIAYGEYEGRRPSADFDPVAYRQSHPVPPFASSLGYRLAHPEQALPAEAMLVEESELFDANYYLANYPDVRESGLDPLAHFLSFGWREGRRPNPYFDTAWYAQTYLAGQPGANPLLHYLSAAGAANRPVAYFDPAWYAARYGLDEPPLREPPLRHFLRHRRDQRHSPTPLFDITWYMERYGAQVGANRDPFTHYLRVGIGEDIDPGPDFDAGAYRRQHMEPAPPPGRPAPGAEIHEKLRREALHPLVHFLLNQ